MRSLQSSWLTSVADDVVLVDTDVWSCVVLTPRDRDPRVAGWRRLMLGKQVVISAQTEGEIRFGALSRGWGPAKIADLNANFGRTPTLPVTPETVLAFATLRAECKRLGHALADKQHMGDAWVAATAITYDLPLLAGDGIYHGAPNVRLLEENDD